MASPQQLSLQEEVLPSSKLIFQQESFRGGMNQQVDPTRLQADEYPLLVNGRTRYGVIEPVELPTNADPQGTLVGRNIQGIYSAGPYFLVFADGKAFYKSVTNISAAFTQIMGFQLDPLVSVIYAEQIPVSTLNFGRKLTSGTDVNSGVQLFESTASSPQCVVCQDGISQPRLIFEDGSTREAGTYAGWSTSNREYVPIGTLMMYLNGILYVVGPSMQGSLKLNNRQIFRSVTGRPLDFVVNIDGSGNKGGDASTTSYAVDYDEITCLARMNSNDGSFFVSTAKNSYLVTPVLTGLLPFNEPRFTTQPLFNTGPINNFSICDLIGDAVFVDFGGIRSFNAVLQSRNEGRNLPFSKKISLLFATLVQTATAAITFDDYVFFAVNTIYGRGILVYDTIQEVWVGIDFYDNFVIGDYVIQFCEIKVGTTRRLFCRTVQNHVYELFAGTDYATTKLYVGDWCSNDSKVEQKPQNLKCVFSDVVAGGTVTLTPYIDRKAYAVISNSLSANTSAFTPPLALPFGPAAADVVRNINFNLDFVDNGWKVGFFIQWNFAAQLTHIRCESARVNATESTDEQAATLFG